ncbi:hypothetical protein ABZ805_03450 [Saccharopolyspora sp. NPDC047091]|uniref:hypothetical protein n=1 Tax=Saccharopolyspora sp. NPDC047091 TaxID=3155924 RepID=UPI003401C3EC
MDDALRCSPSDERDCTGISGCSPGLGGGAAGDHVYTSEVKKSKKKMMLLQSGKIATS